MDPITIAMGFATLVPKVVKLLGGSDDAADMANKVVNVAKAVTGKDDPMEATTALWSLPPEKLAEFRQAIAQLEADTYKAELADVANARALQVAALAQDDKFSKRFVYYFAAAWSLFAMAYFVAVTFMEIPARGQRIADTILGVLIGTVLVGIFHYFFGSTAGGQRKSELLAAGSKA